LLGQGRQAQYSVSVLEKSLFENSRQMIAKGICSFGFPVNDKQQHN
jgi:hypothetical protein